MKTLQFYSLFLLCLMTACTSSSPDTRPKSEISTQAESLKKRNGLTYIPQEQILERAKQGKFNYINTPIPI